MKFGNFFGRNFVGNISIGRNSTINGVPFSSDEAGEQTSERRPVGGFDEIVISTAGDLFVSFGAELSVTVKGSADAVSKTLVEVSHGVLSISSKPGVVRGRLAVEVAMPGPLTKLKLRGAGDAKITGLKQGLFVAELAGAGDLEVSGKVEMAMLRHKGAGDIDASALETTSLEIEASGAGDIEAMATHRVVVDASGAGDITVKGGASDVTSKSRGAGDVKIR